MFYRATAVFILSAWSMGLLADEPSFGPAIEGYGPTFPIDYRDVVLEDDFVYKAVFDAATHADDASSLNTRLISVARFLNMHARNGVPIENMHLAVVLHGAAMKSVLRNDAYNARYHVDNPNLELLQKLHLAGVEFYVCGQSMAFGGVKKRELVGPANVALSAMTMLTVLQTEGYALLP